MRKLFVSYARDNKRDVDQLVEHLAMLTYDTWIDKELRGGQVWWEEVLQRIADSDAFIAVISHAALNSSACNREFDWAEALGKPVVPVAIELQLHFQPASQSAKSSLIPSPQNVPTPRWSWGVLWRSYTGTASARAVTGAARGSVVVPQQPGRSDRSDEHPRLRPATPHPCPT